MSSRDLDPVRAAAMTLLRGPLELRLADIFIDSD